MPKHDPTPSTARIELLVSCGFSQDEAEQIHDLAMKATNAAIDSLVLTIKGHPNSRLHIPAKSMALKLIAYNASVAVQMAGNEALISILEGMMKDG